MTWDQERGSSAGKGAVAAVLTEGFQGSLLQDLDALGVREEWVEMDDAEHIPLVSILGPDADGRRNGWENTLTGWRCLT